MISLRVGAKQKCSPRQQEDIPFHLTFIEPTHPIRQFKRTDPKLGQDRFMMICMRER